MTKERIYLDHNATQPLCKEARSEMLLAMDVLGNPSSIHSEGRAARSLIEAARLKVALLVNCKPSEVIFTSGATEANQMAFAAQPWRGILYGSSEHVSVLSVARRFTIPNFEIPTNPLGLVRTELAIAWIEAQKDNEGPILASISLANGETGVVQPVKEFVHSVDPQKVIVHSDSAQALGRIPINFSFNKLGMMSLSAHKMGGPKGIGALIVRDELKFDPLCLGGGQERRRRAGTENVIGISGFGAAAEAAHRTTEEMNRVRFLRHKLEAGLKRITPECMIFGQMANRLPNTTLVGFPGKVSETLVIKLDLLGVAVSAGSACSSGKVEESHVLKSMGVDPQIARSAIRISLGVTTTEEDVHEFLHRWSDLAVQNAIAA